MILKDIINTYNLMVEGIDFLYKCKEKQITRDDLENRVYPDLSDEFKALEEKGQALKKRKSNLDVLIAYYTHRLLNYKKINESFKYAQEHIFNRCKLK